VKIFKLQVHNFEDNFQTFKLQFPNTNVVYFFTPN